MENLSSDINPKNKKQKSILKYLLLFVLLLAVIFLVFRLFTHTGNVSLNVSVEENVTKVSGEVSIILKQGELLPADSAVKLKLNEQKKQIPLSSLLVDETKTGNFFAENVSLQGNGKGYGISGQKTIYPVVYFKLTNSVEGSVSASENFSYSLQENESIGIEQASVHTSSKNLDDNAVSLLIEDGKAIVTTTYSETEEGFGQDYIGNEQYDLRLNFEDFGLDYEPGTLDMQIIYNDIIITEDKVVLEPVVSEPVPEPLTEPLAATKQLTVGIMATVTCNQQISASMTVDNDLTCNGTALNIVANNVALDCQGHTLTGNTTGYGVNITGATSSLRTNVTIKNCNIYNFSEGIHVWYSPKLYVINNTVKYSDGNGNNGVSISSSNSSNISFNTIINNYNGVYISNSYNGIITQNTISYNNYIGLSLNGQSAVTSQNITVRNNTIQANTKYGVQCNTILRSRIIENNILDQNTGTAYGVYLYQNSDYNNITNNSFSNNYYGAYLDCSGGNVNQYNNVIGNTFSDTYRSLYAAGCEQNVWRNTFNNYGLNAISGLSIFCVGGVGNYYKNVPLAQVFVADCGPVPGASTIYVNQSLSAANFSWGASTATFESLQDAIFNAKNTTTTVSIVPGTGPYTGTIETIRNGLVLDCSNQTLQGSGESKGIWINGEREITIQNCKIQGYANGIYLTSSPNNIIYNNFLNNTNNTFFSGTIYNSTWNIADPIEGGNINNGLWIGGNYWANPSGTGFSQTCVDVADPKGICDVPYNFTGGNKDELPLSTPDTTNPRVGYIAPFLYSGNYSQKSIWANVNATDNVALTSLTTYLSNASQNLYSNANTSSSQSMSLFSNFTNLSDGLYYLNATAIDSANNANTTLTRVIRLDTTYPLISYGTNTALNDTNFSRKNIYVDVIVTEANEVNITFFLHSGSIQIYKSNYTTPQRTINWTNLEDGIYYYNATVVDVLNQKNSTPTRVIMLDTTYPTNINFITPLNGTPNNGINTLFNVSVTETNLRNAFLSIDGENYSMDCSGTAPNYCSYTYIGNLPEDIYSCVAFVNDTAGNLNSSAPITLIVDTQFPTVEIVYPENISYNINVSRLNYTAYDANIQQPCKYSLNGGQTNTTITCGTNKTGLTSVEGSNTWTVYVWDIPGNFNYSSVTFFKDSINPRVSYGNGTEGDYANVSRNWVFVNVTVNETNEVSITFVLFNASNGNVFNESTFTNQQRTINWTNLAEGIYYYNVSVSDTLGNVNTTRTRTIRLDVTPPVLSNPFPPIGYYVTSSSGSTLMSITTDENAVCRYLNVSAAYGNMTLFSVTNNTLHNTTLIGLANYVNYTYHIKCNDSAGNINLDYALAVNVNFNVAPNRTNLSSPQNNSKVNNRSLTLIWNASFDSDIDDVLQYDVLVSNSSSFSYVFVNLTIYNETSYSNSTFPDGTYYWKIRPYDGIEYGPLSETWKFTLDATAPTIQAKVKRGARQNLDASLNMTCYDATTGLDSGLASIKYPDGSITNYTMTRSGIFNGTFNLTIHSLTVLGVYDVNYTINDSAGNIVTDTDFFEVYIPLNLSGNTQNALNEPISITFGFMEPGTDRELYNFTADGDYNLTNDEVHERTYDLRIGIDNDVLIFRNVNMTSHHLPMDIDKFTDNIIPNYKTLNGIAVNTTTYSGNVTLNLSYVFIQDFVAVPESNITVHKCSDWNYSSRTCNGNFELYTDKIIYTNIDRAFINVTNFSAYILTAFTCGNGNCQSIYGETTVTCPGDCVTAVPPTPPAGGSTGGGGGGGGGATSNLQVSVNKIERTLNVGTSETAEISLKNLGTTAVELSLSINGTAADVITYPTSIKLEAGEEKAVSLLIYGKQEEVYNGNLYIKGTGISQTIPILIIVKGKAEKLLDVNVNLKNDIVEPGKPLDFTVSIFNLGTLGRYDIDVLYEILNESANKTIVKKQEVLAIATSLSLSRELNIPADAPLGDYLLNVKVSYDNSTTTAKALFKIGKAPFTFPYIVREYLPVIMALFLIIFLSIIAWYYFVYVRQKLFEKKIAEIKKNSIYIFPDFKTLPRSRFAYVGVIGDTDVKTYLDHTQLNLHTLIAGGTGCGKTVAGMDVVEELLKKDYPVIVFDPVGQWTGFFKKCEDKAMKSKYHKFGLSGPRAFNGRVIEIGDDTMNVDILNYMNAKGLTILKLDRLTPKKADIFIEASLEKIYRARLAETTSLKYLLVLDEVHRLLPKYGGRKAYVKLEQAVREFRKWGIGLLMISQVLTDFKGAIRGNIGTEIQMRSRYEGDIKRVRERHGSKYSKLISRLPVAVGMIESPGYNKGMPYFVEFRPILHSPIKLLETEVKKYIDKKPVLIKPEEVKKQAKKK
jgi:parallel beta-helix repeat protein